MTNDNKPIKIKLSSLYGELGEKPKLKHCNQKCQNCKYKYTCKDDVNTKN